MRDDFDDRLQALLDGRPLPDSNAAAPTHAPVVEKLGVIDAIARAYRTAIFGKDISPDRPVAARWGHLEFRGEIGRGASGTVYRAWDTHLEREVALKLLDPSNQPTEDALEEGRLLARLNHPHIVRVFGADTHDGVAGLWMELLDGDTLEEILLRDGVFSAEEALLAGIDLARALTAVHSAGLLHRDVKARNVLRERGGHIVLMDLGAGRPACATPTAADETGTPMYMAPEVIAGTAATERSDMYCLGILLYRLLAGTFPIDARDLDQLRRAHLAGTRVPLATLRADLEPAIVTAIERACDPDPQARHHTVAEFETALADALQRRVRDRMVVATTASRTLRRWRSRAAAMLTLVTVTALMVAFAWDAAPGRTMRRKFGWVVPPRSTLYLTLTGGIGILRGAQLTVIPHNPATASAIAVSTDLGVLTMAGIPPWTTGGRFRLDGTPAAPPRQVNELCCLGDGATDGRYNYAARQDSTLLEPVGSRPLAPPGLYRFDRDWSHPQLQFPLAPEGVYVGVTYSSATDSFWLTRRVRSAASFEEWSRDGRHVSMPVSVPAAVFAGIAVDPRDQTLWVVRQQYGTGVIRLENFDTSGRFLAGLDLQRPALTEAVGAEFIWSGER